MDKHHATVRCASHRARNKLQVMLEKHGEDLGTHRWSHDRHSYGVYDIPMSLLEEARSITGITKTNPDLWPNRGGMFS